VVREDVKNLEQTLREVTGRSVSELDFTDDRLGIVLNHLSKRGSWEQIEAELNQNTIRAYDLEREVVRCDATTASGYHEVSEGGLFQFGHSKDDPSLPQIKFMTGALDPLGMPLATDVVSGEQSDDGLYVPLITRIHRALQRQGVIYVGDCKLSAFETRLHIRGLGSHYLCPLPQTGKTPDDMADWVREGIARAQKHAWSAVVVKDGNGEDVVVAAGYEGERRHCGEFNGEGLEWTERVLVVKSFNHAAQQERGLERRLVHAEQQLYALTPRRGRGKRQMADEQTLRAAIETIEKRYQVEGLLRIEYEREVEQNIQYVGRGRGGANRQQEVFERIRYQITAVTRDEQKLEEVKEVFGWRAYVTDASRERLCLENAVNLYRQECRIERIFRAGTDGVTRTAF